MVAVERYCFQLTKMRARARPVLVARCQPNSRDLKHCLLAAAAADLMAQWRVCRRQFVFAPRN